MTFEELWEQMRATNVEALHLSETKGREYAAGDNDPLAHFVTAAKNLGLEPEQVWAVFAGKHWSAILTYVREGALASEPIEGRIDDLMVYLHILKAMHHDKARKLPPPKPSTDGREERS